MPNKKKIIFIDKFYKKIFLLILLLLFFNKNTLLFLYKFYDTKNLIFISSKIEFISNLIIFFIIFFFIISHYYLRIKKINFIFIFLFFFISADVFCSIVFNYGKEDEMFRRYPSPYDMFRGKPNQKFKFINNSFGFRGDEIKDIKDKKLTIGFFGGSTGYNGKPPIIEIIADLFIKDGIPNRVYNFSSTSSNHSQHLHRLVEFMEYPFDIIIFYGGGNETEGYYYYDPRPNYPYNFYYKNELNNFSKIILENSFFFYELDKLTGLISRRNILHKEKNNNFDLWTQKILENYFLVLTKAQNVTNSSIKPNMCSKSNFFAFFQPLKPVEKEVYFMQEKILKSHLKDKINNFYDLSLIKDKLNFTDTIHVTDSSNFLIANEIYFHLKQHVLSCNN
jgi:hypothetical protein